MNWTPHSAHGIDLYVLGYWSARYPNANISVRNRWGVAVCGVVVDGATEAFEVCEPTMVSRETNGRDDG